MKDLTITSRRVLTDRGATPGCVYIKDGVISAITSPEDAPKAAKRFDVGDDVVMAGIVDTHVHVNEPGREDWEGFASATRAAAAGGVTSIFDMPLNSTPATTTVAALDAKKKAAKGHTTVNVGFIGGVVPGNAKELKGLYKAGVRMFKCFMVPSGVDDFQHVTEKDLREAMPILSELDVPLLVHAELSEHLVPNPEGDPRKYATYLGTRPDSAETEAISQVIALADEFKTHIHIVHLSSSQSLPMLRAARARGVHVTVEMSPHYLVFDAAGIKDGATEFKCAPPIRSATTRMAMWRALFARDIDQIVSDHSPCPPSMKTDNFMEAWGGIASLQLGLPAVWSEAMNRGASLAHMAEWMSTAPARLAGIGEKKGKLMPGYDADIVVWDPIAPVVVDDLKNYQRHPQAAYKGRTLKGLVKSTFVKGVEVFKDGEILTDKCGSFL